MTDRQANIHTCIEASMGDRPHQGTEHENTQAKWF